MSLAAHHSRILKKLAAELGFQFCGISTAAFLDEEAPRLERWLKNGFHGEMGYMSATSTSASTLVCWCRERNRW